MGTHRSHHFVPRCYLRNFSSRANGTTINLFNIDRGLFVDNAPIKSQCAKPFLYGKDELEQLLSEVEGKYAEWITRGVLSKPPILTDDIEHFVRFFLMIQFSRTEAAAARTRAHFQIMDKLGEIGMSNPLSEHYFDTSYSEMARFGTSMAVELSEMISDLSVVFILNVSNRHFITCDDPVISTNRLHLQRFCRENFGVGSAGAILYLPLSPSVAVIAYDRDVYSCAKMNKYWYEMRNPEEVAAFNDLITLKAKNNIYFLNRDDFDISSFEEIKSRRISDWGEGRIAIPVGERDGGRVFRAIDESERPEEGGFLIHTSQRHPRPYRWPKTLPFRRLAVAYTNGSGAGYIRKSRMKSEMPDAKKVKV